MLKIEISTDNAAFDEDPGAEAAQILRALARQLEDGRTGGPAVDANGNIVGSYELTTK